MRALVTGADGFAGQWLVRALVEAGDEVAGASRSAPLPLQTLGPMAAGVDWHRADVRDFEALVSLLQRVRPQVVYHLAAQASVPASLDDPLATFGVNVMGTAALLEACRKNVPDARVISVGSADAYGRVDPAQLPLREDAPLNPNNPYAASKAAAELLALQYARCGWLDVVAVRPFNHTGPGQSPSFAAPAFASQIAAIKAKALPPVLKTGDLCARRDISDVRDTVEAYRLLGSGMGKAPVYNVCSGRAVSMGEIVDELQSIAGVRVTLEPDPARMRSVQTPVLVGDAAALKRDTGWSARISLRQTLSDLYEWFAAEQQPV